MLELSLETAEKLKCNQCQQYLSILPVHFSNGKYTCGRCNPVQDQTVDVAYEELAKLVKFPCIYKNCKEKSPWNKTETHEKTCLHREILCPYPNCSLGVSVFDLVNHFDKSHDAVTLKNRKTWVVIDTPFKKVFLLHCNENRFFVYIHGNIIKTTTYGFNIKYFGQSIPKLKEYKYGVFLLSGEMLPSNFAYRIRLTFQTNGLTTFQEKMCHNVDYFNENVHCFKCYEGQCFAKNHMQNKTFLPVHFDIDDASINSSIICTVEVFEKSGTRVFQQSHLQSKINNFNLPSKLECPICYNYSFEPIYLCPNGHVICKDCKFNLTKCPSCRAVIGDSRKFAVENIEEIFGISCQNTTNGSKFIGLENIDIQDKKHLIYFYFV